MLFFLLSCVLKWQFCREVIFTKKQERHGLSIHKTVEIIGNQCTGWDGQYFKNSSCSPQYRREKQTNKQKVKKMYCSSQCAVLDFVLQTSTRCSQCWISFFFETASPPPTSGGLCLVALKQHHKYRRWESTEIWWAPHCKRDQWRIKEESLKKGAWEEWRKKNPEGHQVYVYVRAYHTAAVCLMLWKLIRVGEVGIDMARATRTRREWWSCQRCHLFLAAERTWWKNKRKEHDHLEYSGVLCKGH